MPQYSISGPDGKTYTIDGPAGATRDQVIAKIKERLGDPMLSGVDPLVMPPETDAQFYAKDIGRGLVRGAARGLEAAPSFMPSLFETAGEFLGETPEQKAERERIKKTVGGQPGPAAFVERHVGAPESEPGKAAETVGGFLPTAPLQRGGAVTKAVTSLTGGLGAYGGERTAQELGLDPTMGAVSGGVIGGGAGGVAAAEMAAARARRMLPGSAENRAASKNAAQIMINQGLRIDPNATNALAGDIEVGLRDNFMRPKLRGDVGFDAAKKIARSNGDFGTIVAVHSNLGSVGPQEGPNYAAALHVRDAIRKWVGDLQNNPGMVLQGDAALTNDLWRHHRDTWRVHSNLEEIKEALESAEWRRLVSGRGTNYNTLRQEIRKIVDNDNIARRYSDRARVEMEKIVEGDLARNALRRVAAFAPHTAVSSGPAIVAGALGGVEAGGTLAGTAFLAHFLQGRLEHASIERLLDIIRLESPLVTTPMRQRARQLLTEPRASVAAGRGILGAGAGSPLADPLAQE